MSQDTTNDIAAYSTLLIGLGFTKLPVELREIDPICSGHWYIQLRDHRVLAGVGKEYCWCFGCTCSQERAQLSEIIRQLGKTGAHRLAYA